MTKMIIMIIQYPHQVTNTMRYDGLVREDLGAKFTCQVEQVG